MAGEDCLFPMFGGDCPSLNSEDYLLQTIEEGYPLQMVGEDCLSLNFEDYLLQMEDCLLQMEDCLSPMVGEDYLSPTAEMYQLGLQRVEDFLLRVAGLYKSVPSNFQLELHY